MTKEEIKERVDTLIREQYETIAKNRQINKELYKLRQYCKHEYNQPKFFDNRVTCKYCRDYKNINDDADYYQISNERSE